LYCAPIVSSMPCDHRERAEPDPEDDRQAGGDQAAQVGAQRGEE
jgi:hypothetical protein